MNERNLHHHRQLHEWYELHKFNQLNNNNNTTNTNGGGGSGSTSMCVTANTATAPISPFLSPQKAMWIENWRQDVNKAFFKIPDTRAPSAEKNTASPKLAEKSENHNNNNNNNNNNNIKNKSESSPSPKLSSVFKLRSDLSERLKAHHTPAKSADLKSQAFCPPLKAQSKSLSCSFSDLNLQGDFNNLEGGKATKKRSKFTHIDTHRFKFLDTKTSSKSVSSRDCQHAKLGSVKVGVSPPSDESEEQLLQSKTEKGTTTMAMRSSSNSLLNVISVDDCRATVHYSTNTDQDKGATSSKGYQPLERKSNQSLTKSSRRLPRRLQTRCLALSENEADHSAICTSNQSSASENLEDLHTSAVNKAFNTITQDGGNPKGTSRTTKSNSFTASSDSPVFKRLNTNLRRHMKALLQSQRNAVKSRLRPSDGHSSGSGCCLRVCELQGEQHPSDDHLHSS